MESTTAASKGSNQNVSSPSPPDQFVSSVPVVVVDLGTKSKKAIDNLKGGKGRIMDEVEEAIERVRSHLPVADQNKQILPIVLIYRRKRRQRVTLPALPFPPLNLLR
jgi:hypothetical protein